MQLFTIYNLPVIVTNESVRTVWILVALVIASGYGVGLGNESREALADSVAVAVLGTRGAVSAGALQDRNSSCWSDWLWFDLSSEKIISNY
jgi:hypothetical protein